MKSKGAYLESQRILSVGLSEEVLSSLQSHFDDSHLVVLEDHNAISSFFAGSDNAPIRFGIFGDELGPQLTEAYRTLRLKFPHTPFVFVSNRSSAFASTELRRLGFKEAFHLPADLKRMDRELGRLLRASQTQYARVGLADIEINQPLDFEVAVFLPRNSRFVTFLGRGGEISAARLERLQKYNITEVHIPQTQLAHFYDHSAGRLAKLTDRSSTLTDIERKQQLTTAVGSLVAGLLKTPACTKSGGSRLLADTRRIVETFVKRSDPDSLLPRLRKDLEIDSDGTSRASSVSTLAALFGLMLNVGEPLELAIAGLYRDAGVVTLPTNLQEKNLDSMSVDERQIFSAHIGASIELLKAKKLPLSETIFKAIEQHHEKFDGSGFPQRVSGEGFCKEAQMVALADRFEELTFTTGKELALSPDAALEQILRECRVDPEYVHALMGLFQSEAA